MPLDTGYPSALLRLAEWLADPVAWLPDDPAIPPDLRVLLAQNPVLRPLLNDWLAQSHGFSEQSWDLPVPADGARL